MTSLKLKLSQDPIWLQVTDPTSVVDQMEIYFSQNKSKGGQTKSGTVFQKAISFPARLPLKLLEFGHKKASAVRKQHPLSWKKEREARRATA